MWRVASGAATAQALQEHPEENVYGITPAPTAAPTGTLRGELEALESWTATPTSGVRGQLRAAEEDWAYDAALKATYGGRLVKAGKTRYDPTTGKDTTPVEEALRRQENQLQPPAADDDK